MENNSVEMVIPLNNTDTSTKNKLAEVMGELFERGAVEYDYNPKGDMVVTIL